MDMAIIVFQQLLTMILVVLVGYALTKKGFFTEGFAKGVSNYIIRAAIPLAIIFHLQKPFSQERLEQLVTLMLGVVVTITVGLMIVKLLCAIRKVPHREAGVWLACGAFSNYLFIGAPIFFALYGDEAGFPLSALVFAFNLMVYAVAIPLVRAEQKQFSLGAWLMGMARNYGIVASLTGIVLFLFSISLPGPILGSLSMISASLTPFIMLLLGYLLAQQRIAELFTDARVYILAVVKLLVCPILTFLIFRVFVHNPLILGMICIGAAMPAASVIGSICEQYDNNSALCAKVTFATTLLSVVTAPLCILLMRAYF